MVANHPKHHPIAPSASGSALTIADAQPPSAQSRLLDALSCRDLGSDGTENRFKGLDSSNFGLELNFRPCSGPGRPINHRNGAIGVRHVTSRNIFSLSESRVNRHAVKPVFSSPNPKYTHYGPLHRRLRRSFRRSLRKSRICTWHMTCFTNRQLKLLIAIFAVFLALAITARAAPYPKCFPDWKAFDT